MTEALNPELVMRLRVESAKPVARDVRQFDLVHPEGALLPEFAPGAHLLIQAPNGVTRRYSLCDAPGDRLRYSIAVKREASGRGGSRSMVDNLDIGDRVHVSLPRNDFELDEAAPGVLFIAGGIGITPIRSMVRYLMRIGGKPFKLYYLCREPDLAAYRDEFLGPEFDGKVVIHHDQGEPARSFDLWPVLERPTGAHIFCCGPTALMDAVRDMTGHWPATAVHFEDFGVGRSARTVEDKAFTVRIGVGGPCIAIPADGSILAGLRAHGYSVRSSCESGTCGTCRTTWLAGEPDHRDLVLTDAERAQEIMVCVSRAHSSELVIEL
jgi:phthalate 4,5-dioxygenase reductase component